jgi:hypothetical protein
MELPNKADSGKTYAILTQEECTYFRCKMIELLEK